MEFTGTPSSNSLNLAKSKVHFQSTLPGLYVDSIRSGLEVEETREELEVDSMDEIGTTEGLYKDLWRSVRYRCQVLV